MKTSFYSLSGNKGLCGVPSLPQCSLFWENGRLSTGGKIAIGLSCLVFVSLLVLGYIICIRRRRNDYDFAPPHDLMCKYFSRIFKLVIFQLYLCSFMMSWLSVGLICHL